MKDIAVFESVERELNRQRNNIELIASENFVSPEILELAGTVLTLSLIHILKQRWHSLMMQEEN